MLAYDRSRSVLDFAMMSGAVDGELDAGERLRSATSCSSHLDPEAADRAGSAAWRPHIGPHPVVVDCCGTKRAICAACFPIAKTHGVTFLGGHPMAGSAVFRLQERAGGSVSRRADGASCRRTLTMSLLFDRVKAAAQAPRALRASPFTTAQAHDEMIAFTSQMAHVVSNAYIKSPTAAQHKGFSAGSYKDMTRVAWLSPEMWAELFLENKDNLLHELDIFIAHLGEYRDAMQRDDLPALTRLLDEGRRRKEEVDGR